MLAPPSAGEIGVYLAILIIVTFGAMGGIIDFLRRFRARPTSLTNSVTPDRAGEYLATKKRSSSNTVICYQDNKITFIQFLLLAIIHALSGSFGAFAAQLVLMPLGNIPSLHTADLLLFSGICVISGFCCSIFLRKISW